MDCCEELPGGVSTIRNIRLEDSFPLKERDAMESLDREQRVQDMDLVQALRKELVEVSEELFNIKRHLTQQHKIAAQVHRSLLPKALRHLRIDVDVRHLPAEPLGSDYCQVRIPHDDPCACYITMCHAESQGLASALLASRISSEARHCIEEAFAPADMVHTVNTYIFEHFHEANFHPSFLAARIDLNRRRMTYSGAGHVGGMLLRPDKGLVQLLSSQHRSINVVPHILTDTSESILELSAGDRVLLCTNGIPASKNAAGQPLGLSGLAAIAGEALCFGLFEMLDEIVRQVQQYCQGTPNEDMTLAVAELK
jgi:serine phosphatase RsbU (regulator of sigma subunit)